ncbi:protein N-acetylglucosaminyltransferase [Aureococcus anophagefferens]|nr:protein N-acetylglucosaminyltransferase [Aureococcus anophagefferens]
MDHQSAEAIAAMLGMDARSDIVQEAWRAQKQQAQQAAQREKKRRRVERMLGDHLTSGERDLAPASPALEQKRRRSSTDRYAPPSTGKAAEAAAAAAAGARKCEIVLDRLANLSGGLDRAFDFGYAWHRRPAGDYHSNTFSVPGEARRINAGRLVRHLKDLEAQRRDELGVDFETWIAAGGYFPPFA